MIIRDKVYINVKMYLRLDDNDKKYIKSLISKDIVNPYLCNLVQIGRYCNKAYDENRKLNRQVCYKCPVSKRSVKCYKITKKYFIFNKGDKQLVNEICNILKVKLKDKSVYKKLDESLELTFNESILDNRKDKQKAIVKEYLKQLYGQIIAPPRFGKTVTAVMLAVKMKTKVAIIIHQKELLEQFYNTFMTFTNINELSKMHSKRLIAINPKPNEIDDVIIALFTWQQFKSKSGKLKLKKYRTLFGFVISDECHRCSSDIYYKIISSFWARYYVGFTATPSRKDGLHIRSNMVFGPPLIIGGSEQLKCNFLTVNTNYNKEYKNMNSRTWNYLWDSLSKNKERNQLIIDFSVRAIRKGHKVIVPIKRIAHADNLMQLLPKDIKGIKFVSKIKDREAETKNIRDGYYDFVVATKGLISEGFDCPHMSLLILNAGSYHSDENSLYQEYSRVRTKAKDKKKPILVILNDYNNLSKNSTKRITKELEAKQFKNKGTIDG